MCVCVCRPTHKTLSGGIRRGSGSWLWILKLHHILISPLSTTKWTSGIEIFKEQNKRANMLLNELCNIFSLCGDRRQGVLKVASSCDLPNADAAVWEQAGEKSVHSGDGRSAKYYTGRMLGFWEYQEIFLLDFFAIRQMRISILYCFYTKYETEGGDVELSTKARSSRKYHTDIFLTFFFWSSEAWQVWASFQFVFFFQTIEIYDHYLE